MLVFVDAVIPREGVESPIKCYQQRRQILLLVIPREGVERLWGVHGAHPVVLRDPVIPREGVESTEQVLVLPHEVRDVIPREGVESAEAEIDSLPLCV